MIKNGSKVDTPLGKGIVVELDFKYVLCSIEQKVFLVKLNKLPERLKDLKLNKGCVAFNETRLTELN
jgi:hypothetical protein